MGRLPMLTMTPRGDSKQIGSFGGLNKGLVIGENEFFGHEKHVFRCFPGDSGQKAKRRNPEKFIKTSWDHL